MQRHKCCSGHTCQPTVAPVLEQGQRVCERVHVWLNTREVNNINRVIKKKEEAPHHLVCEHIRALVSLKNLASLFGGRWRSDLLATGSRRNHKLNYYLDKMSQSPSVCWFQENTIVIYSRLDW